MSKAILVARREYLENLRTKTFWIGILVFPVILVLAIVIPRLLEKTKDARLYAVIDRSGWLHDAVVERSASPDLERVFAEVRRRAKAGERAVESLPRALRLLAPALKDLDDAGLQSMAGAYASLASSSPEVLQGLGVTLPPGTVDLVRGTLSEVREWWRSLPPKEAADLAPDLDRSRYHLAPVGDLGADPEATLRGRVDDGRLFAYFVIPEDPLSGTEPTKYYSNNLTDEQLKRWFVEMATEELKRRRFEREEISAETVRRILAPLNVASMRSGGGPEQQEVKVDTKSKIAQWVPVAFVYLLWMAIFTIGQTLLTNTIEEKSNRIIEVLLSSISPLALMSGKIIGIAATGLTVIVSWILFFFLALKFGPVLLGAKLPFDLGFILQDPAYLAAFVGYFLAGYLLYAAFFVGIGSVCNSLKEAQNLMLPMVVILIVPMMAMMPIAQDPNGALARLMSYIPLFTPFVMMNRAAGPPSTFDYVATTILMVVTTVFLFWGAAKIFRIGILMTGKPPKVREIVRWLFAST